MIEPLRPNLGRLGALSLAGLVLLGLATTYWNLVRAEDLTSRADNPRHALQERRTARGRIFDRHGVVLAETRPGDRADGDGSPPAPERVYRLPASAPVTGYQTWRYGAGGSPGVTYGVGGAEAAYDAILRGDLGPSPAEVFVDDLLHRPRAGRDVTLTLSASLQGTADRFLSGREGAAVVVEIASGAVLAMASRPTFDPARLDDLSDPGTADAEPGPGPVDLLNRASQGLFTPGSVWKVITLAAALDAGQTKLGDVVADGDAEESFNGFKVRCNNNPPGLDRFDLAHAFAYSCNLTFARLAVGLGSDRMRRYADAFGLTEAPPFALPTVAGRFSPAEALDDAELASAGFGQGRLQVTPLFMALVAAAAGGDGALPRPVLLAAADGLAALHLERRGVWRRPISPATALDLRRAMVTSTTDGWARTAASGRSITLGGKTGTAEVGPGRTPHSWFIGFAPADRPRVAVAVLIANGGDGASVAAPIGGLLLEEGLAEVGSEGR